MVNVFRYKKRQKVYIREWLHDKKWTQQRLANEMGVDKGVISRWLTEPWRLNTDAISAIADAMGLAHAGMLFMHPNSVPNPKQIRELRQVAEAILRTTE
jgi:transcriptional regulator with XRE-family HTH domain